jgi:hypothetical protein
VGAKAAEESREEIMEMVKDADLVFVTAGKANHSYCCGYRIIPKLLCFLY